MYWGTLLFFSSICLAWQEFQHGDVERCVWHLAATRYSYCSLPITRLRHFCETIGKRDNHLDGNIFFQDPQICSNWFNGIWSGKNLKLMSRAMKHIYHMSSKKTRDEMTDLALGTRIDSAPDVTIMISFRWCFLYTSEGYIHQLFFNGYMNSMSMIFSYPPSNFGHPPFIDDSMTISIMTISAFKCFLYLC